MAPLTGEYADLGKSVLYSLQLALDEINDKDVFIVPRDACFNDKDNLLEYIEKIDSIAVSYTHLTLPTNREV